MAVGDIIVALVDSAGWRYFQPSVNTEIIITTVIFSGESYVGHYNGADGPSYGLQSQMTNQYNLKMGITYTTYFGMNSAAVDGSYSGIQIK